MGKQGWKVGLKPVRLDLLITASGSFDNEHKLANIEKKICTHKLSKVKTLSACKFFSADTPMPKFAHE